MKSARQTVWLFDLDDTLHDAAKASMPGISAAMGEYIVRHLGISAEASDALRRGYWQRYGATLLGLVRHDGVDGHHFLRETHQLPGLEARVRGHAGDLALLRRLPGRKLLLTNAPADYARRVLRALGIESVFERVFTVEDMVMFGHWRPKPDGRMLRRLLARLRVPASRCVLVEDSLANQKGARAAGLRTVWMQRWLPRQGDARRVGARPAYTDRRVASLRDLLRHPPR